MRIRIWLLGLLMALGPLAHAQGWSSVHELAEGELLLTNTQANSSWYVVSLLVAFEEPTTGEIKVYRESGGVRHTLGLVVFEHAVSVVWAPDVKFSFRRGETLVVVASFDHGVVHLIRRGD